MRQILSVIYFFLIASVCLSQTQRAFDKALSEISSDLAEKLKALDKKKVVVLYVTDIDKQMTVAGKYLADVVSVNLVNNPGRFLVFDRSNLNEIVEAKKLIAEGYIDPTKAQELKKILGVDVIVVGNYTVLSNTVTLTLKALDTDNGFVIAASMKDLPLDADAGKILDIPVVSNDSGNPTTNPASGEATGRTSVNPNCKEKNTGDYCFQNNTKMELSIQFFSNNSSNPHYYNQTITIQASQKQCFYDLPAGEYSYWIHEEKKGNYNGYSYESSGTYYPGSRNPVKEQPYSSQGNVYVERCQSKFFIIR